MVNKDERFHDIQRRIKAGNLMGGEILLDGKPLRGITSIEVKAGCSESTMVTISLIANIDADFAEVQVDK